MSSRECGLCMEPMNGRGCVSLKCKHEMCPECFALHARINHTCPFCRDVFAPPKKRRDGIQIATVEGIVIDNILSDRDFYYEIVRRINWEIEPARQVAILRTTVANMSLEAMNHVTRWYDAREP